MKIASRIVVTGANGFVAKNLRKFLHQQDIPVLAIARRNFHSYPTETKIVTPQYSEKKIIPKLKEYTVLVHLIGVGKQTVNSDYLPVNVELTKKMIKLCKKSGIKKIIYNSGLGVSKSTTVSYFISKYRSEQELINSGIDFTIFRPSYIIGKDDLLSKSLNKQVKNGQIIIPGSGKYRIQPIFVDDVSKIILQAAILKKYSKKTLDLVGPEIITFENFIRAFNKKRVKIKKMNLESVFHDALHTPESPYGVDDLNILLGNFSGNFKKLKQISGIDFLPFKRVLESSSLS